MNFSEESANFVEVFPIVDPDYLTIYEWEKVELTKLRRWVGQHWKFSIYASAVYVVLLYLCQTWMKNRPAYSLRRSLTIWNIMLACFSIAGFLRTAPELWHVLKDESGFYKSVCTRREHNIATACWGFLMTMSKFIELGDSFYIIFRKSPELRFIHWYHHVTVFIYTWSTYEDYEPSLRWFMTMNMAVHALMYTYYALRAMKVKVPRQWAMMVTFLQISQMIFGVFINLYSVWLKRNGVECVRRDDVIQLALLMYVSYFILFANFFYQSYVKSSTKFTTKSLKPKTSKRKNN